MDQQPPNRRTLIGWLAAGCRRWRCCWCGSCCLLAALASLTLPGLEVLPHLIRILAVGVVLGIAVVDPGQGRTGVNLSEGPAKRWLWLHFPWKGTLLQTAHASQCKIGGKHTEWHTHDKHMLLQGRSSNKLELQRSTM